MGVYGSDDVSVLISESSACKQERKGSETSQRKPERGGGRGIETLYSEDLLLVRLS